jgi:hypothetical protein
VLILNRLREVVDEEARTLSLKQLSGNLSPLTLNLWLCALCGCRALLPSALGHPKTVSIITWWL